MKNLRIDIRVTAEEKQSLKLAALKLQNVSGKKSTVSKVILDMTKVYLNN